MKSALSETLCFQSFGHLLCIFMHYHVYFSMLMSCTFFDRIPSCGCNLSSIIHCSGHKDHMLYRVLGILCGLILRVKDLSSPSLDFCKFSDAISSLKMCKSVMSGLADPLISHSTIQRFLSFQFLFNALIFPLIWVAHKRGWESLSMTFFYALDFNSLSYHDILCGF
jgi:hypothetical protein